MISLKEYVFEPRATFECGQCFRWEETDAGYLGIAENKVCRVCDGILECPEEDNLFWREYFCLDYDYSAMMKSLADADRHLKPCIDYGKGIRILKQPLWETVVSFIISANNNIPRIRKIISALCESFGEKAELEGRVFYAFPEAEVLAKAELADLAHLRAGYRDKYILDAAHKFATGEIDIERLNALPTQEAKKYLMTIKGVGGKVADCILLFAMGRYEVFPQDVWIKRIMDREYGVSDKEITEFVKNTYGELGGFAQQYLYYFHRDNN